MNAFQELQERKAELKKEIHLVEGQLQRSLQHFERYRPHQLIAKAGLGLLKGVALRSGQTFLAGLLNGRTSSSALSATSNSSQSNFWRRMSHQGLDMLLDYINTPKEKATEPLPVDQD